MYHLISSSKSRPNTGVSAGLHVLHLEILYILLEGVKTLQNIEIAVSVSMEIYL